jgi:hypothetical protein
VRDVTERAVADGLGAGATGPGRAVVLGDGLECSVGDLIVTRKNDRTLYTAADFATGGFVRNGDRWEVTDVRRDGALEVRRQGTRFGASVVLPAEYVAEHVDLGYAVTAHRAQGMTVDAAHVLVTHTTTRENLYVALTRGRYSNVAWVATDRPDASHTPPADDVTPQAVLYGVLQHSGAELSARQTEVAEELRWHGIAQLADEYERIAQVGQRPRWEPLVTAALERGSLRDGEIVEAMASDAFDALCAELRRAEAYGHDVETALRRVAGMRTLLDAENPCAVLHGRFVRATSRSAAYAPRLVVGLVPEALGSMDDDVRAALDQRAQLIEERAAELARDAVERDEPWRRGSASRLQVWMTRRGCRRSRPSPRTASDTA